MSGRGDETEEEEDDEWKMQVDARYFMGYFWWHYKKRDENIYTTWWAFFGPALKREWVWRFFYAAGFALGTMLARVFLIPKDMASCYEVNYSATKALTSGSS